MAPLTSARWIVHTAEAVPSATRNSPVISIRFALVVVRPAATQVRIPAVITAMLVITLITFHNEEAGFRICMAGKDAATTRLAASEFTNASRIEIVFKLSPTCSIFYYRVILKPLLVATPPEYLRILGESHRRKGSPIFFLYICGICAISGLFRIGSNLDFIHLRNSISRFYG